MDIGNSVRKAIDDYEDGEIDAAMLHACNAIDGTAAKTHPEIKSNNERFTTLIRDNYFVLEPMAAPGVNIDDTRFPVKVEHPKAPGGVPDFADIIYGVHRCSHGHGEALPGGFELLHDAAGQPGYTRMQIKKEAPGMGRVRFSDRVIFGLLAVAILSPANADQQVPDGYHLTFGRQPVRLEINDWWCCASLKMPMKAALAVLMCGCSKAPQPGWLRGLGGDGAGGRGRGAGYVSVASATAARAACSSTMAFPVA
jgi:hypothetical protein